MNNTYLDRETGETLFRSDFGKIRWIKAKKPFTQEIRGKYGLLGNWPSKQKLQVCRTTDFKTLRKDGFI